MKKLIYIFQSTQKKIEFFVLYFFRFSKNRLICPFLDIKLLLVLLMNETHPKTEQT